MLRCRLRQMNHLPTSKRPGTLRQVGKQVLQKSLVPLGTAGQLASPLRQVSRERYKSFELGLCDERFDCDDLRKGRLLNGKGGFAQFGGPVGGEGLRSLGALGHRIATPPQALSEASCATEIHRSRGALLRSLGAGTSLFGRATARKTASALANLQGHDLMTCIYPAKKPSTNFER